MMLLRFFFFTTLFFLLAAKSPAQQTVYDSLLMRVATAPNDTNRVNLMAELAMQYQYINIDSMKITGRRMIQDADALGFTSGIAAGYKILGIAAYIEEEKETALYNDSIALHYYRLAGNQKGIGAVYNNMAVLYNSTNDFYAANIYYKKSLAVRQEISDLKGVGDCHANLANTCMATGNFEQALVHVLKSLNIRKQVNNEVGVANSYMILGDVYASLHQFDKAEGYYRASLNLSSKIGNIAEVGTRYNNLGGLHHMKGAYDSAIHYFRLALDVSQKIDDHSLNQMVLSNIAESLVKKKAYTAALSFYEQAMAMARTDFNEGVLAGLNYSVGELYLNQQQVDKALQYTLAGYHIAVKLNDKKAIEYGAEQLASCYEKTGEAGKALAYFKIARLYHDSLFNETSLKKIKDLEYGFELEQKEQQISLLEQSYDTQQHRNRLQQLGLVSLIALLSLAAFTAYTLFKSKRKEQKNTQLIIEQRNELQAQADEMNRINSFKNKLFSILAHDLRSPVASLVGIFHLLEKNIISTEEFMSMREGISQQIGALNILLDNLLNWSRIQIQGGAKSRPTQVQVNSLVKRNMELLGAMAASKQIRINNTLPE
ncbi:MAG: tetratricopeptide repeat protein, partial [Bacteroidota bacterium]